MGIMNDSITAGYPTYRRLASLPPAGRRELIAGLTDDELSDTLGAAQSEHDMDIYNELQHARDTEGAYCTRCHETHYSDDLCLYNADQLWNEALTIVQALHTRKPNETQTRLYRFSRAQFVLARLLQLESVNWTYQPVWPTKSD